MATACWLSADLVKVISVVSALTIPREWMALITMRYSKNYQDICSVGLYLHFFNKVYFNDLIPLKIVDNILYSATSADVPFISDIHCLHLKLEVIAVIIHSMERVDNRLPALLPYTLQATRGK